MRWLLVVIGALLLAAGIALAIVYPRYVQASPGPELARWQAYDEAAGFRAESTRIVVSDGSTVLNASLSVRGPLRSAAARDVLVLTVTDESGGEAARISLGFDGEGALQSPQTGIVRYRETVPLLETPGAYTVTPSAGADFPEDAVTVELVVNAAQRAVDPLARPGGGALAVMGLLAVLFGLRRRRENPNSQPQRWGRR